MIFTERKITVNKGQSTIDRPVILYRGDYEVEMRFTIVDTDFKYINGNNNNATEKASHAQLAILGPDGTNVFSDISVCTGGQVAFVLTKEMIDELSEVGKYSFQIRLFDHYRESRVSIPPVEFGIEVREPVASEDHTNAVDDSMVGYSIAKTSVLDEPVGPTFDGNGQYNKTDWETGDRISEGKLNKIEDAIDKIHQNEKNDVAEIDKRITSNYNVLDSTKADKNEIFSMKNMGQDIKEAMTGGSVAVVGDNTILANNIVDGQVYYNKTDFIEIDDTGNMIDYTKWAVDQYVMGQESEKGKLKYASGYHATDFIPVNPSKSYYYKSLYNGYCAFYDANKQYVSGIGQVTSSNPNALPNPFTPPTGACYIRMSATSKASAEVAYISTVKKLSDFSYNIPKLNLTDEQINTLFEYVDNNIVVDDSKISLESVKVQHANFIDIDPKSNIINIDECIKDYYVRGDTGLLVANPGWYATGFIPVKEGEQYYYKELYSGHNVFYNEKYEMISGISTATGGVGLSNPFTVPSGAKYIRMSALSESAIMNGYISQLDSPKNDFGYIIEKLHLTDDQIEMTTTNIKNTLRVSPENTDFLRVSTPGNIFTLEGLSLNTYIRGQQDGSCNPNNGTSSTDFIKLTEDTEYYWKGLYNGYCAFYDANKRYISGIGFHSETEFIPNPFVVPEGTVYGRFTVAGSNMDSLSKAEIWINVENLKPPATPIYAFNIELAGLDSSDNPCDFKQDHYISVFNKIACIGDSMTQGVFNTNDGRYLIDERYSWPTFLHKLTGVETVNMGHGGITSKGWYERYADSDLSGFDCAIIQLGINDVAKAEEQGINDAVTLEYLQKIIDKLKNENNHIKIFVAGISKCKWYNSAAFQAKDQLIINFASDRENENIYCINLKQYSKVYDTPYAAGHLAGLGYLQQAEEYKNYVSYLMYHNLDNFVDVHFTGSDNIPLK